jgi:hypothetical protein
MRADPAKADAEYNANFREDIAGWLSRDILQNAVDNGCTVRPPFAQYTYRAFVDPSGGRNNSFTCGIAHEDHGFAVLDCVVEIEPPFGPMSAISQIAATLREYWLTEVTGDHYAAAFNVEMSNAAGITYRASDRNRSEIYADVCRCSILDAFACWITAGSFPSSQHWSGRRLPWARINQPSSGRPR